MTWENIYLTCFIVGVALSVLSFLMGSFHVHLPHLHVSGSPHVHATGGLAKGAIRGGSTSEQISLFNFGTICAFLAWFGGAGYLLTRYYGLWVWLTLLISAVAGLVGASTVFWFLVKVLLRHERALDPADYRMTGVLGRITVPIRQGGTGEIVFSQEGARRCSGARAEDGAAIPKGSEVVVTRYEKGIAYVRLWEDMLREDEQSRSAETK